MEINSLLSEPTRWEIFRRFQAQQPEPKTELVYRNPFELLIAVILSAQSTDKAVNKATPALFALAPTPAALLALGEAELAQHIRHIGLYRSKAKHIIATCQRLLASYDGQVPDTQAALESLPGVGRKTANVVRNVAFGVPTIAVDTHIFRVANRLGLALGKTPLQVEQGLLAYVPAPFRQHAHHWLILHGRYICTARRPRCATCQLADLCVKNFSPDR